MAKSKPPKPVLSPGQRREVYTLVDRIESSLERKIGLRLPMTVFAQDPHVAAEDPEAGLDEAYHVPWEPGLEDGPTSARFAVVDYNADSEVLTPPAVWDDRANAFRLPATGDKKGKIIDADQIDTAHFRQVNCWAVLQRTLSLFESPAALGRRIPWGFGANRLIVVPHAGYGENAFYDRESKSLQFYYFGGSKPEERRYTCLSADIVAHEFGHALLDGIRPGYLEAGSVETHAFHEFMGDLTAMTMALDSPKTRHAVAADTGADLSDDNALSNIAEEFGRSVINRPYLRTARNTLTMKNVSPASGPHHMSQVLTGAVYEILRRFSLFYHLGSDRDAARRFFRQNEGLSESGQQSRRKRFNKALAELKQGAKRSPRQVMRALELRLQNFAIQPLDLLPPVDVTFKDYALAVLRAELLSNPTDPDGFRPIMAEVFKERGILTAAEVREQLEPQYLYEPETLDVPHSIDMVTRSNIECYHFLNDNRRRLRIPEHVDFTVAQVYTTDKVNGARVPQRRQIVVQFLWREDIRLTGVRFGKYQGEWTTLPCGGTLVFDVTGNVLSDFRKPGVLSTGVAKNTKLGRQAREDATIGAKRLEAYLDQLALRIKFGDVGDLIGSAKGFVGGRVPPLSVRRVDGTLRFELTPHLSIHSHELDGRGGRQWQISS